MDLNKTMIELINKKVKKECLKDENESYLGLYIVLGIFGCLIILPCLFKCIKEIYNNIKEAYKNCKKLPEDKFNIESSDTYAEC